MMCVEKTMMFFLSPVLRISLGFMTVAMLAILQIPQVCAKSEKTKPVILVDHIKITQEWAKDYQKIQKAMVKSVNASGAWEIVPQEKIQAFVNQHIKPKASPSKNSKALDQAKAQLNKGVQAYHGLQFVSAIQNLTKSRDGWLANLSQLRSNRDLIKSHLYLAMALLAAQREDADRLGYDKKAKLELEKAVLLDASLKLSDRIYNPEMIKLFEQTKQRILQKRRVTLRVACEMKNARVYINGKLRGRTPFNQQMIPGTYYVLVEPQGEEALPWSSLVELKDPVKDIMAKPVPFLDMEKEAHLFRVREGEEQQGQDVSFVQNRGKALDAQFVFLANLQESSGYRILGQLMDVRTGEFSQVAFAHLGNDLQQLPGAVYDLSSTLAQQIRSDGYLKNSQYINPATKAVTPQAIGEDRKKKQAALKDKSKLQLHKKWWFWAGIVAVGAGGYFAYDKVIAPNTATGKIKINNKGNY